MKTTLTFLCLAGLLLGCAGPKNVRMNTRPVFDKEGHRGARGLMPENTLAAMKTAVDLGVTTLEMDVVLTSDGEVVLSHEPFFNHAITTKPDGSFVAEEDEKSLNIYHMSYAEVKTYDVGRKPHPRFPQQQKIAAVKPLLRDVMDSIKTYCRQKGVPLPQFNIETKSQPATDNLYHPEPPAFVDRLMAIIRNEELEANTIIQSFDFRTLRYLQEHYPALRTSMLIEAYDQRSLDEQLTDLGFLPAIYSPAVELVTKELVEACHQQHIKIIPWTANTVVAMQALVDMGVDGLISDYPNLFSQLNLHQ